MNEFEKLLDHGADNKLSIYERYPFESNISALYHDGHIALSRKLKTTSERTCRLAEELGHHHTTVGNIMDLKNPYNAKQERQARLWGYNRVIGLRKIIDAFEADCKNRYEIAEYMGVTEEFLLECIDCYRDKYGVGVMVDNYYIRFIPSLMVGKIF